MTIVYVLELFYPNIGGVEKLFLELAVAQVRKGNTVRVVTTRFRNDLPCRENYRGIEIFRLKLRNRFLFTFFGYFSIRKLIKDADIVHTTSFNAGMPAYFAARRYRRKCVITYHEVWTEMWKTLPGLNPFQRIMYRMYEKKLLRLPFDVFVAPSEYTAGRLKKNGAEQGRIKVVYNGLHYNSTYDSIPPSATKYVYFGRAGISKGLEMLIEAAAEVNENNNTSLTLILPVTDDAYSARIKNKAAKISSIEMAESIPDQNLFYRYLKSFSFAVIPSVSEGFCFAAAEAAAIGLPVVSSARGALPETVSGRYIEMKEYTTAELKRCITDALNGKWNEKPLRRFTIEDCVSAYGGIYNEMHK
jgi:glycosyltransferase involved in cell wall biosynthesis